MVENKSKGMSVDLGELSAEDTVSTMGIVSPKTGEPLTDADGNEISITLLSKDSKEYRKTQRQITDRRLSRRSNAKLTAERLESEANEVLARCTKSWSGIVFNGEELDCTYHNAKMLYDKLPWIKEQVDEFVSERSNFLGS